MAARPGARISKGHGNKIDQQRERAIVALLSHGTVRDAARSLKINERTLRAWMKDETFKAEYDAARKDFLHEAIASLEASALRAVKALDRNLGAKSKPTQQIQAAKAVLENVIKRRIEHSGPGGGPIPVGAYVLDPDDLEKLTDDQLAQLRPILALLGQHRSPAGADRRDPSTEEG